MAGIITPREAEKDRAARMAAAAARVGVTDYNAALEGYLREVRSERGYTDRDPSEYYNSGIPRWARDARDWIAFRDRAMVYALEVLNRYAATGEAPCTLAEFDAALRQIRCEWSEEAE